LESLLNELEVQVVMQRRQIVSFVG